MYVTYIIGVCMYVCIGLSKFLVVEKQVGASA